MNNDQRSAVFLINLVQDVTVLRPLVYMATRDHGLDALLLVSTKFKARDLFGIWRNELAEISRETGARLKFFDTDLEAHRELKGQGLIFAASESHLPNHVTTHSVFRHAPSGYLRITLQHGFECIGFRHSADHVRAHGATASFGADLVCSWHDSDRLTSMASSQRSKLVVTGPTAVLQLPLGTVEGRGNAPGLVCENLHSVRLNAVAGTQSEFIEIFEQFSREMEVEGHHIVLRTHPGGQYVLKNRLTIPGNVKLNNAPIYRLDMRRFAYGISAPSSVLIDMLLAKIPTAVWQDRSGRIDAGNYEGLPVVTNPREWVEFAHAARSEPERFVSVQNRFLERQGMPIDPREVFSRFGELFQLARRMEMRPTGFVPERHRLLFVANGKIPTFQLSFERPLQALVSRGEITTALLTEPELRMSLAAGDEANDNDRAIVRYLDHFNPSTIIFCRYNGPGYQPILDWARRMKVPVIYHVDDDLLGVPPDLGPRKHALHNSPHRIEAVESLLASSDIVYASTENLRRRLLDYDPALRVVAGAIYCSGTVIRRPASGSECIVGYMASADHAHNLNMVLPAIEAVLDRNPEVTFELFGSIPLPAFLTRFGARVRTAPPVASYEKFLSEFAARGWDIGICPLTPIAFNLTKADTKWVEYTSVGAAVVASRGTVYDDCCADDCGVLAATVEDWIEGLEGLIRDKDRRLSIARRAQQKLEKQYGIDRLREQVLDIIGQARDSVQSGRN